MALESAIRHARLTTSDLMLNRDSGGKTTYQMTTLTRSLYVLGGYIVQSYTIR